MRVLRVVRIRSYIEERVSQNERKSKKREYSFDYCSKKIIYGIRSIQEEAQEQKVG